MFINLENLKTARVNAGYTTLEATKKVCGKIKSNKVEQWERGELSPTWCQLKELSDAYQVNVFLLTSKEKLKHDRSITDFRKQEIGEELELNAKKFIHFLLQRQAYLVHTMKEEGMPKNALVGSVKEDKYSDAPRIAQFIAKKINYRYDTSSNHLKYFSSLLERKGVFIMKTLSYWSISVENMRGVYLKNEYAPIIALNRKDAKTAQIFTLAHELAHLFINSEGISNIDFRDKSSNPTESFCNAVAANLLLPKENIKKDSYGVDDIKEIAKRFQVSELFVLYRLKDLGLFGTRDFTSIEQSIKEKSEKFIAMKNNKSEKGNYINNMKDSNGHLFNDFISSLYFEHKINAAEASNILKLSVDKVCM